MDDNKELTFPVWKRYIYTSKVVSNLSVKQRRDIFNTVRKIADTNVFFPKHGITFSEFAIWYILDDTEKKNKKK
jgi:hypothetical protein